ncbi:MAG: biotin--[acetyl-CoA-carboxylase] ligase [Clostridia bacterium]|nr:biotin--[acetyl-CoA-carboxylase] ligase [Clostridia bacterium]
MERILTQLLKNDTVSGQALSEKLGVTRAAVWKQIEQLRQQGFVIESLGRQGYRLVECPDSLMAPVVRQGLDTSWAGREIVYLRSVDSTNRYARQLAQEGAAHGTLVLADEQTAGRGRRGRGWISPAGESIYMTLILRPQAHPSQVAQLSLATALAVAQGITRSCGVEARIKWPNDIVCQGRKVCGMLLEMNADEQSVHDVVAGIGINVHPGAVSEEIAETAGALDVLCGRTLRRAEIVRGFLRAFEEVDALMADGEAFMRAYCEHSATLGRRVQVIGLNGSFIGTALGVTGSGALIVEDEQGKRHEVLAADVSVRGLMGYV